VKTKIKFYIGDLVQHIRSERYGIVMSPSSILRGDYNDPIMVCNIMWTDTYSQNLMDTDLLRRVEN